MNEKQTQTLESFKKYFDRFRNFEVITNVEVEMWDADANIKIDTKNPKYDNSIFDGYYTFLIGKQGKIFTYVEAKNGGYYKKYYKIFEAAMDCKVY